MQKTLHIIVFHLNKQAELGDCGNGAAHRFTHMLTQQLALEPGFNGPASRFCAALVIGTDLTKSRQLLVVWHPLTAVFIHL